MEESLWELWKKYGEHLTAPLILIALIILGNGLYDDNQLKKEIGKNCGWGEEDYYCFCEKSQAMEMKNRIDNPYYGLSNITMPEELKDVELDR